jgi:hypothetical protein
VKWPYRKLTLWWALVFLSIGWIVFYINTGTKNSSGVLSPPLIRFALLSAATFLPVLVLFWTQSVHPQASVFPVGTLVPLRTLWRFNGAGIGFPQGSCKAKARYVAKVLPSGNSGSRVGATWWDKKNGVILQNEPE